MRMQTVMLFPFWLAPLALAQTDFAQGESILAEADARAAAVEMMARAEARFECKLEEQSMGEIGRGPEE